MPKDAVFEYMGKLSNDLEQMHKDLKSSLEKMYDDFTKRFDSIEIEVRKTNATIESEIKPKIETLLDCCKKTTEQLTRIENKIDYVKLKGN